MIGTGELLALLAVGALCSLDTVSVAQAMFSRPIVSATLGGAVLGRAEEGLVAGVVMELFALETMPFGASRYPEWGSAGVTAGATYALAGSGAPGGLAVAVLTGLSIAGLGSVSMVWHRRLVARLAGLVRDALASGSAAAVSQLHIAGIASDLARGAAVTMAGIILAVAAAPPMLAQWNATFGASLAWPLILAVAVGGAAVVRVTRPAGALPLLGAGGIVGITLLLVR